MRSAKFESIKYFDFVRGSAVTKASRLATEISFVLFDRGQRKFV